MLKKMLIGVSICCGAIMLFFLDGLISQPSQVNEAQNKAESKNLYNEYGLPNGSELSDTLIFSNEEVVCYTDRIFTHFITKENSVKNTVQVCDSISDKIQGINHFIIMPIPSRILYENGYEEDRSAYDRLVKELNSDIPKDWMLLDIAECFDDHNDEYLYYRTENSITLLGGLYAANELVESLGVESLSIDKFQTFQYNTEHGDLYKSWVNNNKLTITQREQMRKMELDPVFSYSINGRNFDEVIYKSETLSYERPAILRSSIVGEEAVGNDFLHAVIDGDGRSFPSSIAFVVGDLSARKIAPYLAYYYDTVCVIAINRKDDVNNTIQNLMTEYETADFIWAQDAGKMGDAAYSPIFIQFREEL